MGAGLYHDPRGETIYFEPFEHIDPDDPIEVTQDEKDDAWENALTDISESIPADFTWTGFNRRSTSRSIAHSELHDLQIREDESGYGYVFLTVTPRNLEGTCDWELQEELEERAEATTKEVAERVFTEIYEAGLLGELRKGRGYTSETWKPEEQEAPAPKM